jgi:ABC-type transport system substrate-binding protein
MSLRTRRGLALLIALLFVAAACGGTPATPAPTATGPAATPTPAEATPTPAEATPTPAEGTPTPEPEVTPSPEPSPEGREYPPGFVHPSLVGLDDVRVRNAIHMAINKEDLWNTLFPGHPYVAACSNAPPSSWWYDPDITCDPFDPVAAGALLDEAGWPLVDGVRTKDGQPMRLILCTTAGNPTRLTTLGKVNQYLTAVGIPSDIRTADAGAVVFAGYESTSDTTECALGRGNYHLSLFTYLLSDPGSLYFSLFHSANIPPGGDHGNWVRIIDPELDALLEDSLAAITQEDILATLGGVQQAVVDLKPEIPLYYRAETSGFGARLGNATANPAIFGPVWNVWEWTCESQCDQPIVIGEWQTPNTANPYLGNAWVIGQAAYPFLAPAMEVNDEGQWFPYLLDGMPVAEDTGEGFSLTMNIKSGLTWSDGEVLDGTDFVETYEWAVEMAEAAACSQCGGLAYRLPDDSDYFISDYEVSADGLSVTWNWRQKFAGWIPWAAFTPLPMQYMSQFTAENVGNSMPLDDTLATIPASGPFVVTSASTSAIDYAPNPNFTAFDGPQIQSLRKTFFADKNGMIAAFLSGEVDQISNMTQIDYDAIKDVNPSIGVAELIPAWQYEHLDINSGGGMPLPAPAN